MPSNSRPSNEVPILVINRDDAPDRLVAIWADAERLGLRIERVAEETAGDAARARLAAHAAAWLRIAEGGSDFAIVAADDLGLDERLLPLLNVETLAREFDRPSVVNLDGGPSGSGGQVRIVPARSELRSFGAYIIDRATARRLSEPESLAGPTVSLQALLAELGIDVLVASPPPVANAANHGDDVDDDGWMSRIWRRLTGPRSAIEAPGAHPRAIARMGGTTLYAREG